MSASEPHAPWHVRMGQFAIGRPPQVLKATLGSCLGIAVLWPERELYALAHCLLPRAPQTPFTAGARYVDQALHTLLQELGLSPPFPASLAIHLAGGANMSRLTHRPPGAVQVGQLNIAAASLALSQHGLQTASTDLGGVQARKMTLDCGRGTLLVEQVPSMLHRASALPTANPAADG